MQVPHVMLLLRFCALSGVAFPALMNEIVEHPERLQQSHPFGRSACPMSTLVANDIFSHGTRLAGPASATEDADGAAPVRNDGVPVVTLSPTTKSLFSAHNVMEAVQEHVRPDGAAGGERQTDYVAHYRSVIEHASDTLGAAHPLVLHVVFKLSQECSRTGRVDDAIRWANHGLESWRTAGHSLWDIAYMSGCCVLGQAYESQGSFALAVRRR